MLQGSKKAPRYETEKEKAARVSCCELYAELKQIFGESAVMLTLSR